ncbi:HAD family hydrolase [Micrococcus sp.]|uniref:HAD family hydrolase n=1 Tax=Micrococcus sp. TaxID=1271 RepID=UPI0026DAE86E|nr:HAD family hydrolase [Micrococcus sp.]MDO4239247.1 HAD family hydrolase [Micrococcus sp.]
MTAAPAPGTPATPAVAGVLFDLDDTLMDLRAAQLPAFTETVRAQWPEAPEEGAPAFAAAAEHFAADLGGHYPRYLAGELDFLGQRLARARDALALLGAPADREEPDAALWTDGYEERVRAHWRVFDDVVAALAGLREAGVGVGIVTNNVEAYQRGKADAIGLADVAVLVGSDTAGAPKPDAAPFLEGCRRLGLDPADVACVGDSLENDVRGAQAAGLVPVWLCRPATRAGEAGGAGPGVEAPVWDAAERTWRITGLGALAAWFPAAGADLASADRDV